MALRSVVLPAPFGPITPRIRPSSTCRSTPSRARVEPYALRSPRASMQVILLLLFLGSARGEQIFGAQAEALDRGCNPWPLFGQEPLAFGRQEERTRARIDEHSATALALDQVFVDQLLIRLEYREWVDPGLRGHRPHGGQRVAFAQDTVKNHGDHPIAQLAINRLTVVPFSIHPEFLGVEPRARFVAVIVLSHMV